MPLLSIDEFKQAVEFNIDHGVKRSILGLGGSGIGKSAVIADISNSRGIGLIDLRLLLYTEVELKGVPFPSDDNKTTKWLHNSILPIEERDGKSGILLIEEITSASKRVQAAAYQLIYDRKLGDYKLPDDWYVVALGNREDDNGVYVQMPSPLANRFEILTISHDLEIWKRDFAYKHNVNPLVIAYLNYLPDRLHTFNPESESLAFASPRSWEAASDILNATENDIDSKLVLNKICGNIGDIEGNSFIQFCKLKDTLSSIDDILAGKEIAVPEKDDQKYLLISSMINRFLYLKDAKTVSADNLEKVKNAINFVLKFSPEFTILALRDLIYLNKKLVRNIFLTKLEDDSILEFLTKNKYIFD